MVSSEITTGEWCIDGGFTPPHHVISGGSPGGGVGGGGGELSAPGPVFPFLEWRFGIWILSGVCLWSPFFYQFT